MRKYLDISYLKDNDPEWAQKQLENWRKTECINENHLWDEVLSGEDHYLYCDACGLEKNIKD